MDPVSVSEHDNGTRVWPQLLLSGFIFNTVVAEVSPDHLTHRPTWTT